MGPGAPNEGIFGWPEHTLFSILGFCLRFHLKKSFLPKDIDTTLSLSPSSMVSKSKWGDP